MMKSIFSFLIFVTVISCSDLKESKKVLSAQELTQTTAFVEASPGKRQQLAELQAFQEDLQSKKIDKIPDYLGCPKRVEEIDLETSNSVIRNDVESNSFRLSSSLIATNFDLVYTEMDLNIINEAIKSFSSEDILASDNLSTNLKIGECIYQADILMKPKEVNFNIKSLTEKPECKKNQKWKFVSNGEILVLDHRKTL